MNRILSFYRFFLIFSALLSVSGTNNDCQAKKIRQSHKFETKNSKQKNDKGTSGQKDINIRIETGSQFQMITGEDTESLISTDLIKIAGYDKPLTSTKETFHVINNTISEIKKIGLRITYLDMKDRMFHSREISVDAEIPAGETRLITIPSWDIQKSFFYYKGPEPKKTAAPYKVSMEIMWIEIPEP